MERVKKNYSKKKSRSIFKSKPFLIFLIAVLSVVSFLGYLYYHPFYQLTEVGFEGLNLTSEGSLENFVKRGAEKKLLFDRSSLVFISPVLLERKILTSYPHIEKVKITKQFPDTLNVVIKERGKAAIWCSDLEISQECYEIDSHGIAFQKQTEEGGFRINHQFQKAVEIGEAVTTKERIDFIFRAKSNLEDSFEVLKMTIPYERSLFIDTEEGFQIRLDFEDYLTDQLERLEILLSEEVDDPDQLEYVDLRYGSSVYYKK